MSQIPATSQALKDHFALCTEVLHAVESDAASFNSQPSSDESERLTLKKTLLQSLKQSLDSLRALRMSWQKLTAEQRAQQPDIMRLVRQNQDLIMRIIVLDRENEQALLRRGLVPARHLPPAPQRRPHFVAELYRRKAGV